MIVRESINFERGRDPLTTLNIGYDRVIFQKMQKEFGIVQKS